MMCESSEGVQIGALNWESGKLGLCFSCVAWDDTVMIHTFQHVLNLPKITNLGKNLDCQSHIWNILFLTCDLTDKIFQNISLLGRN